MAKKKKNVNNASSENPLGAVMPVEQALPPVLNILPIQGRPIFPGIFTPLQITNDADQKTVDQAMKEGGFLGISLVKNDDEKSDAKNIFAVGCAARIVRKINLPDGGINVFISTVKRFKIRSVLHAENPVAATVNYLEDEEDDTFQVKALTRALISEMKEISENNPMFSEEMRLNMVNIDHPGKIADFIASVLNIEKNEQQKILETVNVRQRMEQVLVYIKKEQELLRIQKKIQHEINERVEKNQRNYFLREEMKSIQEELGTDAEGNVNDYKKFKEKIDELKFEGEIKETVESELSKFQVMDPNSPEYIGTRNYLELVTTLPWRDDAHEDYDLQKAKKILDREHYGLDDVKKRIVEFLAVRKLKKDDKGSILLLVGPPGVGKTSVGHSIASAMGKPFFRFSVGGMRDEAEIKGHRRTYIGAMPGKIIQGLKITKTRSPVFLIDEVDKMGQSHQGDPASALLEVLDPEQNVSFRDNYLDLPFDASDVFFILTANTLDSIPAPLMDRAEVIQIPGYIDQEKIEIARHYLIPKNLAKNGLRKNQVKYTRAVLVSIAEEYAREAGVRSFEKALDKINRKIVTKMLEEGDDTSKTYTVDSSDLHEYLGKPVFDESTIKRAKKPGTAIGLAWTSMGGDTLLLEAVSFPSKNGGLELTGQMGDVMKESARIAFNWARRYAVLNGMKNAAWFDENTVHLHIPEGATPKDGPSAGITMATTFISLFSGKIIRPDLAMTGELSLTGQVLPIGGLREKTVAAKRNGIKTILIPKPNERDLEETPDRVKAGIKFIPVTEVSQVMESVF